MALATVEERYPDELRADFQQYYGLNIDGMGSDYSYPHAAVLMTQLPHGSRLGRRLNPDNEWEDAVYFLAAIEYDLRVLAWQNTKDAQRNRNKPKPNETPHDLAKKRERAKAFDKGLVDSILGKEVNDGEQD